MAKPKGKKKKKKKSTLSPEERQKLKIQRTHRREIRSIFATVGFSRVAAASNKEIIFQGTTSDFDDVFIFKNVLALVEYTIAQESYVSAHLKNKKILYDKILKDPEAFIDFLGAEFPGFEAQRGTDFISSQFKVVVVYCSVHLVKKALKQEVSGPKYLDFQFAKYFKAITQAIKQSARYEFLYFLGLDHAEIGENAISPSTAHATYDGSILPEGHSHFRKGYKVISFYVDPAALLSRCYVLRKDRWEERGNLYQRMISKSKIESIRRYLLEEKRVFINNIIVTLPSGTKLLKSDGSQADPSQLVKTAPVQLQLPSEYNSVGLVDGQHRVFSYYEGGANEDKIAKLRVQQNLLATGIIYPPSTSTAEKRKFEAKLFLEINATQTNAKSDIKQAIGLMLQPFSPESIAKEVVNHLNEEGPLSGQFERFFFEKGKLKTTSVVSYGIRPIVKLAGDDSLFNAWKHSKKANLEDGDDPNLLAEYVEFCVKQINLFLAAIRVSLPKEKMDSGQEK